MRRPNGVLALAAWTLPVLLLAGCAEETGNRRVNDPLMGGNGAPPSSPRASAATTPAPAPQWGKSNAALAANPRPSLGNDNHLAIENRPGGGQYLPPVQQANWVNDGLTLTQAKEKLRIRGVNWEAAEPKDGQFVYRCSVANPQNPNLSRFYEVQAADELSARRAVLEQMDKGL